MRVLVVHASQYGATKGIAERIAETLRHERLEVDVKAAEDVADAATIAYDAYVVGSAIHAGHWLKDGVVFVRRHATEMARVPVWLFSSGPVGDAHVHQVQPDPNEVPELKLATGAREHVVFGGALSREAMATGGWLERTVSRFLPEGDFRDWGEIERWAHSIATALAAEPSAV